MYLTVYKTYSNVQKANNSVQNKDRNVHARLLRKARKAVNESVEAEAKAVDESAEAEAQAEIESLAHEIDFAEFIINLLKLVTALCLPSVEIILVSRRKGLSISVKDTHVWDACLNAYGKRVCV